MEIHIDNFIFGTKVYTFTYLNIFLQQDSILSHLLRQQVDGSLYV